MTCSFHSILSSKVICWAHRGIKPQLYVNYIYLYYNKQSQRVTFTTGNGLCLFVVCLSLALSVIIHFFLSFFFVCLLFIFVLKPAVILAHLFWVRLPCFKSFSYTLYIDRDSNISMSRLGTAYCSPYISSALGLFVDVLRYSHHVETRLLRWGY